MISVKLLTALVFSALLHMSPSAKSQEPAEVHEARFQSIAQDIAEVSLEEGQKPLFKGEYGRAHTALFEAAVAWNESGLKSTVDSGIERGDHGRSICIMQIQKNQPAPYNYTAEYLLADRKNCLRAGLAIIRNHRCSLDLSEMMRGYMSGSCKPRQNPVEEAVIKRAARDEVSGYISFLNKLKREKFDFSDLNEPMDDDDNEDDVVNLDIILSNDAKLAIK